MFNNICASHCIADILHCLQELFLPVSRRASLAVRSDQCTASSQNIHCTFIVLWSGQIDDKAEAYTDLLYIYIYVCMRMYVSAHILYTLSLYSPA